MIVHLSPAFELIWMKKMCSPLTSPTIIYRQAVLVQNLQQWLHNNGLNQAHYDKFSVLIGANDCLVKVFNHNLYTIMRE